jgi:hypothetical protein
MRMVNPTLSNFMLIKDGLDLREVRGEIARSGVWVDMDSLPNRARTHVGTRRIELRTNRNVPGKHYHDTQETRDCSGWRILVHTRRLVEELAGEIGGELGRVRIASLRAGRTIEPHIDVGEYCAIRDRYHVVIDSPSGTLLAVGDEAVVMRENQLWWFDNKKPHSVKNLGDVPRTHLIFDLLGGCSAVRTEIGSGSVK